MKHIDESALQKCSPDRRRFLITAASHVSSLPLLSVVTRSVFASSTKVSASSIAAIFTLTAFGADPTGRRDSSEALVAAFAAASKTRGAITGDPSHIYRFDKDVKLQYSNVTLNLQNALVIGEGTIILDGDSNNDGDWSKAIQNVHITNVRFGNGGASKTKAIRFIYCINSSMSNIIRHSYGDTGVEMFFCKNSTFSNITSRGGKDLTSHSSEGAMAALMLHCQECVFENINAVEGPFVMGIQVKGGINNTVKDCTISDVKSGQMVKVMRYGFYNRGDAPWGPSPTSRGPKLGGYSYPYRTGNWNSPDVQRATHNASYHNCVVKNCENVLNAFQSEQFIGGGMVGCKALGNGGGTSFAVNATSNGAESGFTIQNCESVDAENFGIAVIGMPGRSSTFGRIVINGNVISGSGYSGIYATNAEGLAVSDNTIDGCCLRSSPTYAAAILVRNSPNAVISDNQVESTSECNTPGASISVTQNNPGLRNTSNTIKARKSLRCPV